VAYQQPMHFQKKKNNWASKTVAFWQTIFSLMVFLLGSTSTFVANAFVPYTVPAFQYFIQIWAPALSLMIACFGLPCQKMSSQKVFITYFIMYLISLLICGTLVYATSRALQIGYDYGFNIYDWEKLPIYRIQMMSLLLFSTECIILFGALVMCKFSLLQMYSIMLIIRNYLFFQLLQILWL
jgi:hypothetical protein